MNVYRDPAVPIEESVGETFAIALQSIPSTGYVWRAEFDASLLELSAGPRMVPRPSTIGGGGEELFEFEALQAAETLITMNYQREWEKKPRKTELFQVHIAH